MPATGTLLATSEPEGTFTVAGVSGAILPCLGLACLFYFDLPGLGGPAGPHAFRTPGPCAGSEDRGLAPDRTEPTVGRRILLRPDRLTAPLRANRMTVRRGLRADRLFRV